MLQSWLQMHVAWATLVCLASLGVPPHIVMGGGCSMLSCFFTSKASAHSLYWILLKVSPCWAYMQLVCNTLNSLSLLVKSRSLFWCALEHLSLSSSELDESLITIDSEPACRLRGFRKCGLSPSHQSWLSFLASLVVGVQSHLFLRSKSSGFLPCSQHQNLTWNWPHSSQVAPVSPPINC